jgi:hypothetical protein
MVRAYANMGTDIWDDDDFCALSPGAQRTYFMLQTQKEITACGTLPLTMRRWALTVRESDRHLLPEWLDELAERRYVVIDHDTEELLVRTFVRDDGGYKHAKRVLAVISTAEAIRSQALRNVIARELAILGVPNAIQIDSDCEPAANQEPPDSESIGNQLAIDSGRVVVTEVSTDHNPQPITTTHIPQPGRHGDGVDEHFDRFWDVYPRKVAKGSARKAWQRALRAAPPEVIIRGAERYSADKTRNPQFTAHPATWLNAERWSDENPAGTTRPSPDGPYRNEDHWDGNEGAIL